MSAPFVLGVGIAALLNLTHRAVLGWLVLSIVLAVVSFATAVLIYRNGGE